MVLDHWHPDAIAAAHAHSTYRQIWSTTGKLLRPITQDSCAIIAFLMIIQVLSMKVVEGKELQLH